MRAVDDAPLAGPVMFPFYWVGAATAAVFLLAVMAIFGVIARALHATESGIRDTVVPGLLSGFRDWAGPQARDPRPARSSGPEAASSDLEPASAVETRRLRPTLR